MANLNPHQKAILSFLLKLRRRSSKTTGDIADATHMSWNTAEKYLNIFYNWGWASKVRYGKRTYWKAKTKHNPEDDEYY